MMGKLGLVFVPIDLLPGYVDPLCGQLRCGLNGHKPLFVATYFKYCDLCESYAGAGEQSDRHPKLLV